MVYRKTRTKAPSKAPKALQVKRKMSKKKYYKKFKLNPIMKKLINQQIMKKAERHSQVWEIFKNRTFDSVIAGDDIYSLAPNLSKGVNSYQMLGDSIRLKNLYFHLFLRVTPIMQPDQLSNSIYLRLMVFYPKEFPNQNDVSTNNKNYLASSLLRIGDAELNYDGTYYRMSMPLNRAQIRPIYTKDFYVNLDNVDVNAGSTSVNTIATAKSWQKHLKINIPCYDKEITFTRGSNQYPENFNPMLAIGYTSCNGTAQPDGTFRILASCYLYSNFVA